MNRRKFLAVGLPVAIGALSIVTWFGWLASSEGQRAGPGLTLLVNLRPSIEVTPGTPLLFELSLGSSPSSAGLDIGSRWRPWHELMYLEAVDEEADMPYALVPAAMPRSIHLGRDRDGRPSVTDDATDIAHLEAGRHVHTVTFAAGPEETAKIKPGTHRIRGVLETPFWLFWGWRGRLVSAAVNVEVVDASAGDERGLQLEGERLVLATEYYLTAGRFADAHNAATSLMAIMPDDWRSHMLLGDTLAGLDRHQEALDAYYRAMAFLPPSYEKPYVLMERIGRLTKSTIAAQTQR